MSLLTTLRGTQLYIKVGNGASPEVFSHPCLINTTRGIQFQSNGQDIAVPDCADPDALAWTEHEKQELSATITGAGLLDNILATIQFYDAWFRSPDSRNVQVWTGTSGKWAGAFHLTDLNVSAGGRGTKAEITMTLKSDGLIAPFA